jgi:hypothetical protein
MAGNDEFDGYVSKMIGVEIDRLDGLPTKVWLQETEANQLIQNKIYRLERIERAFRYLSEKPVINTNEMFWQRDKDGPLLDYMDSVFAKNQELLRRLMAKEWK